VMELCMDGAPDVIERQAAEIHAHNKRPQS
jgi:hypothetical protein